jgi:hypothetical protein
MHNGRLKYNNVTYAVDGSYLDHVISVRNYMGLSPNTYSSFSHPLTAFSFERGVVRTGEGQGAAWASKSRDVIQAMVFAWPK